MIKARKKGVEKAMMATVAMTENRTLYGAKAPAKGEYVGPIFSH
jgi:hypothetical protein